MTTLHLLATDSPYVAALVVALVIGAIGVLIWASLPEPGSADIERQCQTLRRKADHAVQTRPRVMHLEKPWISLRRIKRLLAVRAAKKRILYSPDVRAAWRRSRRASAALGKTIQAYERAAKADKPKACGGGICHHRADCSDTYCPGRLSASLAGTQEQRHAHH